MAKDRETPCMYYICSGQCEKGRKAEHWGYCQRCRKYIPRVKEKHENRKKSKINKERQREFTKAILDME